MKSNEEESIVRTTLSAVLIFLPTHFFALSLFGFATAADKPNIIIFLADDLGYADIGVNGCKDIPTPNIDSIANSGVRFTDGYATHPVCSPSRAALMSGMYQHRFGFEHNSGPERFADSEFGLPREIPTLAEKLKNAGYATGMIGKWHIGFNEGLRPHERGFDYHFGFLSGARSYLPGKSDNDPIVRNGEPVQTTKYLTDEFADEAVGFLDRSKDKPFLLYFAFNAVHAPMDSSPYEDRLTNLAGKRRTFAGMLTGLDLAVGRVMEKMRELNREENTLVMFYSDNGGPTPTTTSRNDPLRGFKAQMFEGGIRVPFLMQWKGRIPAGQTYREPVMGFDCHATALAAAGLLEAERPKQPGEASAVKPEGSRTTAADTTRKPLDGVDLIPFVTGKAMGRPHESLFWRAGMNHAVRIGDWKLTHIPQQGGSMLFNLRDDIGEQRNLAASHPDKLRELQAAFTEWEKGTQKAKWVRQDQRSASEGSETKTQANPNRSRRRENAGRIEES
ncbi:MAG: sulfatase-like hydrolase/transferase, partial [Planctomycetes bacterium]|nr:sulfatase-like hydrolase/transferase [Planctomycetota bacterium]